MSKKKIIIKEKKETLFHKLLMAMVSASVMAIVGGFLGYHLTSSLPELYYEISPVQQSSRGNLVTVYVKNLGRGPSSENILRYTFNQKILSYTYNYSEGLNGKLPTGSVAGGAGSRELLLSVPRIQMDDTLDATFRFAVPSVNTTVKVFSKQVMGRPYAEWKNKANYMEKLLHRGRVIFNSIWYLLRKPSLNIPVIKVENLLKFPQ